MKRQKIYLVFVLIISMIGGKVNAYDFSAYNNDGDLIFYEWIDEKKNAVAVCQGYSGYGYSGGINIPASVSRFPLTFPVTRISNEAFQGCKNLTWVSIPNSVTSIGNAAFQGCINLTKVSIPNSVTSIGDEAFEVCRGLTYITISNSVTTIGRYAFLGCTSLTSLTIPSSVKSIGNQAFKYCSALNSIIVESGNTVYDSRNDCNAIIEKASNTLIQGCKNTIIPNSVTNIGDFAFVGCSGLKSIAIPESVTSIGMFAFQQCRNLISVTIPYSVKSIDSEAFEDCNSLISVTVESSIPIAIKADVFSNRANATLYVPYGSKSAYMAARYWNEFKEIVEMPAPSPDITFADATVKALCVANWDTNHDGELSEAEAASVTSLGNVFEENSTITSFNELRYFTGLTSIGDNAFALCTGLTTITIPSSVTLIDVQAFYGCTGFSSITIPNSVTSISGYAFQDCSGLTSITIPSSVTSIDALSFMNCTALTSIVVESGNTVYDSRNDCNAIIEKASNTLILGCKNTIIPNSVMSIGMNAFCNCNGLTSVTIPGSVTSIGMFAFQQCRNLISVTIPNSVMSIGEMAFFGCNSMTSVTVESSTPIAITENVFSNRANATLYVPYGSKSAYMAARYWNEFKEIVEMSVLSPAITFADATVKALCVANWDTNHDGELSEAEAASVTSLGEVFEENSTITSFNELRYFTGLTSIGDNAFALCTGLTTITIPSSVTLIDVQAFYGCTGFSSIIIPNSVTSIGYEAFRGCTGLTSFTIPNSVTSISGYAFFECSGLTSITIPSSVTFIDALSFSGCTALTNIVVESGNTVYDSRNNCNAIIEKASNTLIQGCKNTIIPNTVTSIGHHAFVMCSGLTNITIPESVTSIGKSAFYNCGSLTSVTVESSTPIAITENVFSNRANATLYVPYGSKSAYMAADYWKEFKEIVEIVSTTVTAKNYTRMYGDANPTFEYDVTGTALTGTPQISCEATATSPVGTYDIIISQGSVTNKNVRFVKGTLTITKAPLTIKAGTYTKKQGEDNPDFTLSYEGFKNNETNNVLTKQPTVTCEATKESKPGEYTVKVNGAEAQNYDISYVNGVLVVTDADAVIVTVKSYTRVYGDANPTFEYDVTGTSLTGTPQISCEASATSPVGTYDIIISQGSVTNYNVTYVNGTLTITKAPLSVGVQDVAITEGDAIPSFTLTYSGFRNGDTESKAFTTKPKATTTATSTSKPGTYAITVSGGDAKNYALTYTQGTLTIQKKSVESVTITADDKSMTYGDDVPTLTYKSTGVALNGTPKLSTTAKKTSPVGTYPIKVEKGTVTNEQVTYVDGTLTITKAPLSVGVQDVTITEGDAIPSFALTYSGFRNGDTESKAFTTKPTATTTATSSSKPGTYPIAVSGGDAQNYSLTYTQGTLTIKKKDTSTSWINLIANSNMEGNDVSSFYSRENMAVKDEIIPATIVNGAGKDGSRGIVIHSVDNPSIGWNTQFFVRLSQSLPAGAKYRLSFDHKASLDAYVTMESQAELGEYIWAIDKDLTMNTSWQHYESEGTVTEDQSTNEKMMRTLAFNLTHNKTATIFYLDNIVFEIDQNQVEQPVTITADDKSMTYGDDVPTLTYKSSGAALNGTPKLSTTATKTSPVGTYPIKVEKGTVTNEQVTFVDGTLTIEKAPLTVGVQDVTITEGDAIPSFTLTYNGFRNGDTESKAFSTKPKATTTATSTSKPGTYAITVSGGDAKNYALTYKQGTLTIQKKSVESVTITADNKSMTYGDNVPTLTYKSSGAALNGTPKLSTTAKKTSPVGTYPIKVEKGTVTNEQVTYVDGTLTITKAPLTVGVQDVTITEGDAIPSFALTYSGFRNGDTESKAFTTKPTATTTATSSSKPGTYPIVVSGGDAKNYVLTYTQGTLTIKKKDTSESWRNLVVNSHLEGNDVSSFYSRENMAVKDEIIPATIVNGAGKDGSRGIVIHSVDNPSIGWNTQFFVRLSQSLPAGAKYRLSFDHKASLDAYVTMESQAELGEYIWAIDKDLTMNTSWQHYESEGTVTEDQSTNEKMMRTLAFNLTHNKTATTFYLDNIVFEIDPTTDIKTVNTGDQRNDAIFNLSGQRLSKAQKGINIIGGKKVMVK